MSDDGTLKAPDSTVRKVGTPSAERKRNAELRRKAEQERRKAEQLEKQGVGADVVSMVCTELFDEQDAAYKEDILPNVGPEEILRVSIEAGTTFGWERYTMANGLNFGIDRFGASAPASDLFKKFGLTADQIVPQIISKLND